MSDVIASATAGGATAQGASSTSEFQFQDAGKLSATSTPGRLRLRLPPLGAATNRNKHAYEIIVGGKVTGGTTTNFTVNLDSGDSATIGTNTTIFTTGARAVNTVDGNWHIKATIYVDDTDDNIRGFAESWVNLLYQTPVVLDAFPAQNPANEMPFTVTGTFSASNAGNLATCEYFHAKAIS